jgi:hypothetical protein
MDQFSKVSGAEVAWLGKAQLTDPIRFMHVERPLAEIIALQNHSLNPINHGIINIIWREFL